MNRYNNLIEYFGVRNQMKKLSEECYELIEAIDNYEDLNLLHDIEDKDVFRNHVVEEMGDVLILLTQFIAKYNIEKYELDAVMDYKLDRTDERIASGYYEK